MPENKRPWTWSQQSEPGDVTLILVGDTNIQGREDPAGAFKYVYQTLNSGDVVFGQLEGPLSPPSDDPDR